jgi:hypothetical protein
MCVEQNGGSRRLNTVVGGLKFKFKLTRKYLSLTSEEYENWKRSIVDFNL